MKRSFKGSLNTRANDALVIVEVGLALQALNPEGISSHHLNKCISSVIQHFMNLDSTKQYGSMPILNLYHAPYRYGEIIYRTSQLTTNSFGIDFIDDLIKDSHDPVLKRLGIKVISKEDEQNNRETRFFFPASLFSKYSSVYDSSSFRPEDKTLIRALAGLYAQVSVSDITALATCPTIDAYLKANDALVRIWLSDVDALFQIVDNRLARYEPLVNEFRTVNQILNRAFDCAEQLKVKFSLYDNLDHVVIDVQKRAEAQGFEDDDIAWLSKLLFNPDITDTFDNVVEIVDSLTCYIGLCSEMLHEFQHRVSLSESRYKHVQNRIEDVLLPIGLTHEEYTEMIVKSSSHDPASLSEVSMILHRILGEIRNYLQTKNLPTISEPKTLFPR